MRSTQDVFHLAVPARDLAEAEEYYVGKLGCRLARRYANRITLDFFGDHLVCHLSDDWDREPVMNPRHFGVSFYERAPFDALLLRVRERGLPVFAEAILRYPGKVEEHDAIVLRDPSNNLLEFKYYTDPRVMY
jgi:hypothetical protein